MRLCVLLLFASALWGATITPAVIPVNTLMPVPFGQTFLSFTITQAELDAPPPVIGYLGRPPQQTSAGYTVALYYTSAQYVYETVFDSQHQMMGGHPENVLFPDHTLQGEVFEAVVPRVPAAYTLRLWETEDPPVYSEGWIITLRPYTDPPGLPGGDVPEPATWLLLVCGISAIALGSRHRRSA
jgi:hypothetical protein